MAGRGGRGRGRLTQQGFTFDPKDLKIETSGMRVHAVAVITHIPTGISAEGHNPRIPGSILAAKAAAMQLLGRKMEGHEHETFGDGTQDPSEGSGEPTGTPHTPAP